MHFCHFLTPAYDSRMRVRRVLMTAMTILQICLVIFVQPAAAGLDLCCLSGSLRELSRTENPSLSTSHCAHACCESRKSLRPKRSVPDCRHGDVCRPAALSTASPATHPSDQHDHCPACQSAIGFPDILAVGSTLSNVDLSLSRRLGAVDSCRASSVLCQADASDGSKPSRGVSIWFGRWLI